VTRALAAALLGVAFAGCAAAPPVPEIPPPRLRVVELAPVEDRRAGPAQIVVQALEGAALTERVHRTFSALGGEAWVVRGAPAAEAPADLVVRPRVLKGYATGLDVTRIVVVVLQVELVTRDGAVRTKVLRGQSAAMNWFGGEDAFAEDLQKAVDACALELQGEILKALANAPVAREGTSGAAWLSVREGRR